MSIHKQINLSLSDFGSFLEKLSENSDQVYWLSSPDFKKIEYISPAYEQIWGRSRDQLYSNPDVWITFLHPDDILIHHPIEEMTDKVARLGEAARFSINYRIVRPDGDIRWIMDKRFPIYDSKGICCGVTGVAVDVTQEKQYELQLTKAKEAAESANLAKTEFIANMSHDIRTPLSGVVGMSQLLVDVLKNREQKQYAEWLNDSGKQLLSLLNDILDIISVDQIHDDSLHQELFDLRKCLQDIIELERPTIHMKGLDIRVGVDAAIPQYIKSDATKLHRILLNLLGNAIKFTDKGQILIEAKLLNFKNQHATIKFSVTDNGIGIAADQQEKVFERFHRAIPSYKGLYTGHGVGLHIAQSYAKLLGGSIEVSSQLGFGSMFSFELRVQVPDRVERPTQEPLIKPNSAPPASAAQIDQHTPHLLLVEDNNIALKVAEAIALSAGCRISIATDGEQALALAKAVDFALILTDIGLPGISGYEFTRCMREWEASHGKAPVPIVGLTAHAKLNAEEDSINAGMNDVFSKPITLNLMQAILTKYLNSAESKAAEPLVGNEHPNTLGLDLPQTEEELFLLDEFPILDIPMAISSIGNENMLREILQLMMSDEILKDIKTIEKAHADNDWAAVEKLAHKMKGGAVYIGTVKMKYACQYLERYQKAGHNKLLEPLYQQLITVVSDTQSHIKQWLSQH